MPNVIDVIPMPNGTDTGGLWNLAQYDASASGGIFWPVIVLVIWVVAFIASKSYSSSRAFMLASFLASLTSVIFSVLNLMSYNYMYISILMLAIGAVWVKLENSLE